MKAMVSLSGGQDSATCLAWARKEYPDVAAVSINYGQRHEVELECAAKVAHALDVHWTEIGIGEALTSMGAASLTNPVIASRLDAAGTGNEFAAARGLPSSFVPGRNIVLLGVAAAFGLTRGCEVLVSGICQEDEAGYPDCRSEFADAFEEVIALGTDTPHFVLVTPLMARSKAQTWQLADELGVVDLIVAETHTCYEGDHDHKHDWGYGCGECPACQTRRTGWEEYCAGVAAR